MTSRTRRVERVVAGLTLGAAVTSLLATVVAISAGNTYQIGFVFGRFGMSLAVIAVTATIALPLVRAMARISGARLTALRVGLFASPLMYFLYLILARLLLYAVQDSDRSPSLVADIRFAVYAWPMTLCWLIGMAIAASLLFPRDGVRQLVESQ